MTKHIHIHVHRAATQDSSEWDESKHKRAANGQFGSGGGGAKKPAAKSSGSQPKKSEGPAQGEVGSSEKEKYGAYFKKGEVVRLPGGKTAEVISHVGPSVETTAGNFHPTKISAAPRRDNPYNVSVQLAGRKQQLAELQKDMKTGKYSPEDMEILREKESSLKRQIANYEAKTGGAPVKSDGAAAAGAATAQAVKAWLLANQGANKATRTEAPGKAAPTDYSDFGAWQKAAKEKGYSVRQLTKSAGNTHFGVFNKEGAKVGFFNTGTGGGNIA